MTFFSQSYMFYRYLLTTFLAGLSIFQLTAQSFSSIALDELPQLHYSKVEWVDFNADDVKDIFISGADDLGNLYTTIFINNNDSTFTDIGANFSALYNVKLALNDYNKDGNVDFLVSGLNGSSSPEVAIYKNNGNNTIANSGFSIASLSTGDVLWEDFNNDSYPDIVICGLSESGNKETHVYNYSKDDYVEISTNLPNISNGTLTVIDYNNDGRKDILVNGINSFGAKVNDLYKNNGNFQFEKISTIFDRISNGTTEVFDYDTDGDEDIFIAGFNHLGQKIAKLYSNESDGIFSFVTSFDPVSSCDAIATDFNNDGYVDIILSGITETSIPITRLYTLSGIDFNYSEKTEAITGIQNGSLAYADFNQDGKNDFILTGNSDTGPISILYSNNSSTSNTAPSIPASLSAIAKHDSVLLSWEAPGDDLTALSSLTYNIYVGTSSQAFDIISPCANISNGINQKTQKGLAGYNQNYLVTDLSEGLYYWSVQAIDNATGYSEYSGEQTFTICHNINLGNDTSLCKYDTLVLSIGSVSDVVNWYSAEQGELLLNSHTLTFPVTENDKVIVELTNNLGCTLYDTISVSTLELPVFSLGVDQEVCLMDTVRLSTQQSVSDITWHSQNHGVLNDTDTSISYIVRAHDVIWSQVENNIGCSFTDSINIDVLALPEINLGTDLNICYSDSTLLSAYGFSAVSWTRTNSGIELSTEDEYWHKVFKNDTITVIVHNSANCRNSDTILISPIDLPEFTLGDNTSICYGSQAKIYPDNSADSLNWYFKRDNISYLNTDTLTFISYHKDTIIAEYFAGTGCVNFDTIIVDTITLPYTNLGADTAICYRSSINVSAPGEWDSISWYCNNNYVQSNTSQYTHTVNSSDMIRVKVFDLNGCINSDTVNISILSLPAFSLPKDTALCYSDTIRLSLEGMWDTIMWHSTSPGDILNKGSNYLHQSLKKDSIWVEVVNNEGCSDIDSIIIDAYQLPEYNITNDTTLCYGEWLNLSIENLNYTTNWYDLDTDTLLLAETAALSTQIVNPVNLRVEVENKYACIQNDTISIKMNPLPVFSLGSDTAYCYGDNVSLYVNQNFNTISWKSANTPQATDTSAYFNFIVNYTDTIFARITDLNKCSYTDSIIVEKYDLPVLNAGEDVSICQYDSIVIGGNNSNNEYTFNWAPDNNISSAIVANPHVSPYQTSTYVQTITNDYNCSITDTIIVEVNPKGTIDAGDNIAICIYDSIRIGGNPTASGADLPYTYQWFPAVSISNATTDNPIVFPRQTTDYQVIVKSGNCLIDTAIVKVVVNSLPEITKSEDVKIGLYDEVQLSVEGGVDYEWFPASSLDYDNIPDPIASPEVTTTYVVKVTNENDCVNTDSIKVELENSIFIPTLFTPNNDGNNDYFRIYGFGIEKINFKIYDIHGIVVYETDDPAEITDEGWDGTYQGKKVSAGKYFWHMAGTYYNSDPLEYENNNTGTITILK